MKSNLENHKLVMPETALMLVSAHRVLTARVVALMHHSCIHRAPYRNALKQIILDLQKIWDEILLRAEKCPGDCRSYCERIAGM